MSGNVVPLVSWSDANHPRDGRFNQKESRSRIVGGSAVETELGQDLGRVCAERRGGTNRLPR
jgi:hypothetical protein